jgi:hypothetical protein
MGEGRRRIVVDPLYRILFSSTNESTLDTYNHNSPPPLTH